MSDKVKRGFIFDLDGVIVDTAKYHFKAWKKLANGLGIDFTKSQNELLKGVSRAASLEKIVSWGNKTITPEEFKALMRKKNDDYLGYIEKMDADEILVDVPRVLNYLKDKEQGIALGSASKNAKLILEKVGLYHYFQVLVDGNEVEKGKPHPEVFLKGAAGLNLAPEACIVFEDSVAGIQAAKAASMYAIGIGDENVLSEADVVFPDFTKLTPAFLHQLINQNN